MKQQCLLFTFRVAGLLLSLYFLLPGQLFADDWFDYYRQAKQAAQQKEWHTVIELLNKAIAEEPEPARHKQYGLRAFAYYPYMELGMAYLAFNDMEAAFQNCTLAQQKGSAPQDIVQTCLSIASTNLPKTATPTPLSAPTPDPSTQVPERPVIELAARPPSTTTDDAIILQGAALGQHGVAMIKFFAENRGVTGITTLKTPHRPRETFNLKIPLDFGLTTITIEVTDTQGEQGQHIVSVERLPLNPPDSVSVTPTVPLIQPTATPVLPTATPVLPSPTPVSPTPTYSTLELLLQEGERYFEKRWFTTGGPNGNNAFDTFQQVLQLDPTNTQARNRIYEMMGFYTSWGENNIDQVPEKARSYYERYLQLATYAEATFDDAAISHEIQAVQRQLEALAATPTFTPTLPPTPIPAIPAATPVPVIPTPTPRVLVPTAPPVPAMPTITPIPATPPSLNVPDARPTLQLLSPIPSETTLTTLTVRGIAEDAEGIIDVQVHVINQANRKGLLLEIDDEPVRGPQAQVQFTKEIPLALGANAIQVIARDTLGQEQTEIFQVTRLAKAVSSASGPVGDLYAVIIGIGKYEDPRLNLRYTVNDAQGLYDLLVDPNYGGVSPDHITLLLNEEATDRNIKGAIGKWLHQEVGEDDTVLIYYSGHGAPEGNETYWVTYNADIDDLYTTALSNHDIANMLDRIPSKRVITFLDSCYSAATVHRQDRTRTVATEIPWENFTGTGRVVISASDGTQESLELDEYQHGVFTYYVLEGLRGEADTNRDHIVDVDEIWDYVKYQVTDAARRAGNTQTPVLQGAMTAGIPLLANQQSLAQEKELATLQTLFEQGELSIEHFDCAVKMIETQHENRYLDGLLSGQLSPDTFARFFTCP